MFGALRILIFHGYLLRGTGSNIYNASLVRALVRLGHEVHLLCQDRHAEELDFVDAVGDWSGGSLEVRELRDEVRCTAYRPDIGGVLPVYVADTYEGFRAVPFADLDEEAVERYVQANAAAAREVAERGRADVALANHLVMGPAILARGIGGDVPYAVKVHGSALEYTVKPNPDRFLPYAREGLAGASAVLVGSRHTAESLWTAMGDAELPERTRLGPPGVDTHEFRPRPREEAAAGIAALAERLGGADAAGWGGEAGAAEALRALDTERDEIVTYVGKLIVSKGVDLLIAAWPLVSGRVPSARLCVIGFGTYREALQTLASALAGGDLDAARDVAARGRELEGGPPGELTYLRAFLDGVDDGYLEAARAAFDRLHFTGRLEHDDLPPLLAASSAQVVPSTFPEAFGMVAAEAAACGALPVSAAHSGLLEVSRRLQGAVDEDLRPLLSFERGPDAVEQIAERLTSWLLLDPGRRSKASAALSELARATFGWEGVAKGVIAAAEGHLSDLPRPSE